MKEHVAVAEQLFRAAGVQNRPGIHLGGHRKSDSAGNVRLNHAGDNVYRRALGRNDQVHACGTGHLGQTADGVLHLILRGDHQIRQLVDDNDDLRHFGQIALRPLFGQAVVAVDVADAVIRKQLVAAEHLAHRPV